MTDTMPARRFRHATMRDFPQMQKIYAHARELMARAFDAREFDDARRAQLIAAGRWRVLGFGIATQLCFLIPLGAVVTMPAAVAGATMLSRELIDRRPAP